MPKTKPSARVLHLPTGDIQSRHGDYAHTITGILHKRVDLYQEAQTIRERLVEIRADMDAMDRTLRTMGYEGALDAAMPRARRHVVFGSGELTRAVLGALRDATGPLSSREVAESVVSVTGRERDDRKFMSDVVKRVGKALRALEGRGAVRRAKDAGGGLVWTRMVALDLP